MYKEKHLTILKSHKKHLTKTIKSTLNEVLDIIKWYNVKIYITLNKMVQIIMGNKYTAEQKWVKHSI